MSLNALTTLQTDIEAMNAAMLANQEQINAKQEVLSVLGQFRTYLTTIRDVAAEFVTQHTEFSARPTYEMLDADDKAMLAGLSTELQQNVGKIDYILANL